MRSGLTPESCMEIVRACQIDASSSADCMSGCRTASDPRYHIVSYNPAISNCFVNDCTSTAYYGSWMTYTCTGG